MDVSEIDLYFAHNSSGRVKDGLQLQANRDELLIIRNCGLPS